MSELKKLSVNLVTYNGERFLFDCLDSLKNQTFQDFDLKILDNGSFDKTLSVITAKYPDVKIISYRQNLGFAKAHNQLIAWSKEPYILLLNQDIVMEKNYLATVMSFMDENSEVAGASGKLLKWDTKTNKKTELIDSLGLKISANHSVIDAGQGAKDEEGDKKPRDIFGLSGALPLFRRSALEKIKLPVKTAAGEKWEYLDEDFFAYKEDVDLAYRLRLNGQKVFYLPSATAYHNRTVKTAPRENKTIFNERPARITAINIYSYRNHLAAIFKNEFILNLLKCFFPLLWYEIKKFVFLLIFERPTLKGLLMFLKDFNNLQRKRKYIINNIRRVKANDLAVWYGRN